MIPRYFVKKYLDIDYLQVACKGVNFDPQIVRHVILVAFSDLLGYQCKRLAATYLPQLDAFVNYQQIGSHVTLLRFTKAVRTDKKSNTMVFSLCIIPRYFYSYLDMTIHRYIVHPQFCQWKCHCHSILLEVKLLLLQNTSVRQLAPS